MKDIDVCDETLASVIDKETRANCDDFEPAALAHKPAEKWDNARTDTHVTSALEEEAMQHFGSARRLHNETHDNVLQGNFPKRHKELDADGTYHYVAIDDLPFVGRTDAPYKVTSTGDIFVYDASGDGQYLTYNPYDPEGEIEPKRVEIVDDTTFMPTGGTGPLAVIYNVHALRRDLLAKAALNWSFIDMVPKGIIAASDDIKTQRWKYFRNSHKALLEQIRTVIRKNGVINMEYIHALKRINVDVWYDVEKHEFGFKDGEFVVVFA
ncbi:hypothetical protein MZD04_gp177 [Pseudomonas phage Psa21]|uniref:Uncharacterized protein n=1 Tax=Pseudomonas phage Psa21 TaxID=2530023 RepID=A0A481W5P4_9CAUD|nr:hypothetical protein MZD04_gp177 [Pseudomonas phage Psa21]QBJ02703.1 hypothetical protein PSA21_177 [Pseudomonas phage Psa21]